MTFDKTEWLGRWESFESYIESREPALLLAWNEAEEAYKKAPGMAAMFADGPRGFWRAACSTVTAQNPARLGEWNIEASENGLWIEWLSQDGRSLGREEYELARMVEKGLEGKENFLFCAHNAAASWPFHWLLAMAPMPARKAHLEGGLLSHLHFQFASSEETLLKDGRLCSPRWYATMCDAEGSLLEKCNIVRAMHRLPVWTSLPENCE